MIEFTERDIFELPVDIRVNPVNCAGAMGAGLALAFKSRYPQMYKDYRRMCTAHELKPGLLHVWRSETAWVVNLPTKSHWLDKSTYDDVGLGLDALRKYLHNLGKVSVAIPALGCGHGGLNWDVVSTMIRARLKGLEAMIFVVAHRLVPG